MATNIVQSTTLYLAGSGAIIGATSVVLTSFNDIYGNALALADFGAKGYITLEPDTTNEEAATFTSVTTNANGTVTLGGISTALAKSPYTETSGLVRQHSGGTKVVITDTAAFWNTFLNKNNDSTVLGKLTFTSTNKAIYDIAPTITDPKELVTKAYADALAIAGAPDASTVTKGIARISVAPVSAAIPITVGDNDPRIFPNAYGVDAQVSDTYVITLLVTPTLAAGQHYSFKANTANTGACTLNINGTGAKPLKFGGVDPIDNTITALATVDVVYDGTNFNILSTSTLFGTTVSKVLQLNTSGGLPAINGSLLTNIGIDYQVFTANGTWTKLTNLNAGSRVVIECFGAGGGAGGVSASTIQSGAGGGGAYFRRELLASLLGATESVTVGIGGAGGAAGLNSGAGGGSTSFGSWLTAGGGGGGGYGNGVATAGGSGGGGGQNSSGGTNVTGGGVTSGGGIGAITTGDQDGFAGGFGGAYNLTVAGSSVCGGGGGNRGAGGNSVYGGGGGGGQGNAAGVSLFAGSGGIGGNVGFIGNNGVAPSGGAGTSSSSGGAAIAGASGAIGECRVTTYR